MPDARRGRVLIVDNDPDFRRSLQVLLSARGYAVFPASNPLEARQVATQARVHVAVLDIRLVNDLDHDDISGLELAKTLDPLIAKIMLSAYPSVEIVRSSLADAEALNFVYKEEGPDKLLDELGRAFSEKVRINFELAIHWQGISLAEIAREIEVERRPGQAVLEQEIEEAMSKLFYAADEILVTPLIPAERARSSIGSGAVVMKVQPHYQGSGWGAALVVKLAERNKIIIEAGNYQQYVDGFVDGFRHTDLRQHVQTHLLGGIVYTLVGTSLEECVDLGTFYAQHSASEVIEVLKGLFLESCRLWYANRQPRQVRDLVKLYTQTLKLAPDRLEAALREAGLSDYLQVGGAPQELPGLETTLVNPIQWLREHPSLLAPVVLCCTHGDLHSRNVLVDHNRQAWMIDFYRTGYGHMLRDLIELESDVKFSLLESDDLPGLLRFESALLHINDYSSTPTPPFQQPELQKAFFVVVDIRRIAAGLVGPGDDMRDYYQGLLLQTLAVLRLRHISPAQKRHAYLAAALLCKWLGEG